LKFAKYKVGILVLIMMVLIQITLPYFLSYTDEKSKYTKVFENNFRLGENVDTVVFDAFLYHIQKASGYKVVFIGDSVVEGATVKDNANTIPAYFKELTNHAFPGKDVLVYNLAIPGNRSSDIYYTYRKIYNTHAADLIIMNLNYAFYSDEMLKEALIARSELYKKEIMSDEAKVLGLKYAYLESDALKLVEQWHLYGMREELSYNIFGANPRQKLFEVSKKLLTLENGKQKSISTDNSQSTLDKPWWANKPYPEDKINHWMEAFHIDKLDNKNVGFLFLNKMISDISKSQMNTITFLTPINWKMVDEYNLMKFGTNFNNNMGTIKEKFHQGDLPLLDFSKAIDSDEFNDLFHLISNGNKKVAELLLNATKDIIQKGDSNDI